MDRVGGRDLGGMVLMMVRVLQTEVKWWRARETIGSIRKR